MLMGLFRIQLPPLPFAADRRKASFSTPAFTLCKSGPKRRRPRDDGPEHYPHPSKKARSLHLSFDMETFNGHVRTPGDAIILFEACRLGLLPRVQRRLSEKERQSIKSGSVFVWDEREAGMRRWTDGKSWSASRVSGSFLTYREMEGKRGGGGNGYPPPVTALARPGRTPDSAHGSESDLDMGGEEGPDGYRYKPDGLVKQSFSITTSSGNHLHLISYYSRSHPASQQLNSPSSDPALRHIHPAKGMYPESTVHEHQSIPPVTRSPMAGAPYSTVPQMAGYARQGPSQWPQQQIYGWSPPPPQHAQQQYYGYQYAPSPHSAPPPPPPPANGHPHPQYTHPAQYPAPRPSERTYLAYENRPPPLPHPRHDYHQSPYDSRRYPSAPADNRPPPPPQQHLDNSPQTHRSPQQQQYPTYPNGARDPYPSSQNDSQRYPGRPPPISEHLAPPTQHPRRQSQSSNGANPSTAPLQSGDTGHLALPTPTHSKSPSHLQQPQHPSAPSTPIDPQLIGPAFGSRSPASHSNELSRTSTPSIQRNDAADRVTPQANGYGTSSASIIPSINTLMNGSSAESHSNGISPPVPNDHPANGYTSYAQTPPDRKSPPSGTKGKDGPQDIPSEKVGFGEDMRALKVLDRAFRT